MRISVPPPEETLRFLPYPTPRKLGRGVRTSTGESPEGTWRVGWPLPSAGTLQVSTTALFGLISATP